jgi:hypothetical protein
VGVSFGLKILRISISCLTFEFAFRPKGGFKAFPSEIWDGCSNFRASLNSLNSVACLGKSASAITRRSRKKNAYTSEELD